MSVRVINGDCLDVLKTLADNSIDAVCTDPPYGLEFMGKEWDGADGFRRSLNAADVGRDSVFGRSSARGPEYRAGSLFQEWCEAWAREVIRVLKPGGHLAAFSSTRTYHRMACAIEDAGFEIRDQLAFCYGTGFPKSRNISKDLHELRCTCEGVASREATEHVMHPVRQSDVSTSERDGARRGEVLLSRLSEQSAPASMDARKERESGDALSRAGKSSVEGRSHLSQATRKLREREIHSLSSGIGYDGQSGRIRNGAPPRDGEMGGPSTYADRVRSPQGPCAAEQSAIELGALARQSQPQERRAWGRCERCGKPMVPDGLGTALKPSWEPICLARKPLSEKTVAANCLRWGTGAINVDGCRVGTADDLNGGRYSDNKIGNDGATYGAGINKRSASDYAQPLGRFPANLCLSWPEDEYELRPDITKSQMRELSRWFDENA